MAGSGAAHLRDETGVLRVENLTVEFPIGTSGAKVHAVTDVSLDLLAGETLGVVGESGCGKSTTGKAIMRVPPPTRGRVLLDGVDLGGLDAGELRQVRGRLQMIFQDPISSLNPRRTIRDIVAEPLLVQWLESFPRSPVSRAWESYSPWMVRQWKRPLVSQVARVALAVLAVGLALFVVARAAAEPDQFGRRDGGGLETVGSWVMAVPGVVLGAMAAVGALMAAVWLVLVVLMPAASLPRVLAIRRARPAFEAQAEAKVADALEEVGIPAEVSMPKYPHEFSGGQAQRISIARALVLDPEVIICDEPVSALDVSVQAQVLNLLEDLKAKHGLSLVFIAHDLAVVKNISDRVAVMYLGKTCEVGDPDEIYARPRHPYTRILMSAIPVPDPGLDPRRAETISGELPSPVSPPSGCRFRTRCPRADATCAEEEPVMSPAGPNHYVACHHPLGDEDWHVPGAAEIPVPHEGETVSSGGRA